MSLPTVGKFAENIYPAPASDIVGASPLVDGVNFDAEWWGDNDTSDGTRLRVSFGGVEVASDPFIFDDVAEDIKFRFDSNGTILAASSDAARTIRTFTPNTRNTAYAASDTFGQYNAYDEFWGLYLPDAGLTDRTSNQNNGSAQGGVTAGGATGQAGAGTGFDGIDDFISIPNSTTLSLNTANGNSWFVWYKPPATITGNRALISKYTDNDPFDGEWFMSVNATNSIGGADKGTLLQLLEDTATARYRAETDVALIENVQNHIAKTWDGTLFTASGQIAYADGSSVSITEDENSFDAVSNKNTITAIGAGLTGSPFDTYIEGILSEVQFHSTERSSAYISEEYSQTNDNATFWGTWTTGTLGGGSVSPNNLILSAIILEQTKATPTIIADDLILSSIILQSPIVSGIITPDDLPLSSIILESPSVEGVVSPNGLLLSSIILQETAIGGTVKTEDLILSAIILESPGVSGSISPDDLILSAIILEQARVIPSVIPDNLVLSSIILGTTKETTGIYYKVLITDGDLITELATKADLTTEFAMDADMTTFLKTKGDIA